MEKGTRETTTESRTREAWTRTAPRQGKKGAAWQGVIIPSFSWDAHTVLLDLGSGMFDVDVPVVEY